MEQAHTRTYFFTVAALDRADGKEIDAALRECQWTGGGPSCTATDFCMDRFTPAEFQETKVVSSTNHSFWILTRRDLSQQWVVTPDEHDYMPSAFGPSPFSERYFAYQMSGEIYPSDPADLNMVVASEKVVKAVGWDSLACCVTSYIAGNLGEQNDADSALSLGGHFRVNEHVLGIARGDYDCLETTLLNTQV